LSWTIRTPNFVSIISNLLFKSTEWIDIFIFRSVSVPVPEKSEIKITNRNLSINIMIDTNSTNVSTNKYRKLF